MKKSPILNRASDNDWKVKLRSDIDDHYCLNAKWYICGDHRTRSADAWFGLEDAKEIRLVVDTKNFKGAYKLRVTKDGCAQVDVYDPQAGKWVKDLDLYNAAWNMVKSYEKLKHFYGGIEIVS
jgi:hypothetical protein